MLMMKELDYNTSFLNNVPPSPSKFEQFFQLPLPLSRLTTVPRTAALSSALSEIYIHVLDTQANYIYLQSN